MSESIIQKDLWNAMSECAQRGVVSKHKVVIKTEFLTKDGKPKCVICGREMKKAIDSKTGQVSSHTWELNCECAKKIPNLRLSIG